MRRKDKRDKRPASRFHIYLCERLRGTLTKSLKLTCKDTLYCKGLHPILEVGRKLRLRDCQGQVARVAVDGIIRMRTVYAILCSTSAACGACEKSRHLSKKQVLLFSTVNITKQRTKSTQDSLQYFLVRLEDTANDSQFCSKDLHLKS